MPVGFALFYDGSRMGALDEPLLGRLRSCAADPNAVDRFPKEARDDEFYLDSLAVSEACRGQGVGGRLLRAFEGEAAARGHNWAALIVEQSNDKARRFYVSLGYEKDGELDVAGHRYDHMRKPVSRQEK